MVQHPIPAPHGRGGRSPSRRASPRLLAASAAVLLASCERSSYPYDGDDGSPPNILVSALLRPAGARYTDAAGGSLTRFVRSRPPEHYRTELRPFDFPLDHGRRGMFLSFVAEDTRSGTGAGEVRLDVRFTCVWEQSARRGPEDAMVTFQGSFVPGRMVRRELGSWIDPTSLPVILGFTLDDLWKARCRDRDGRTYPRGWIPTVSARYSGRVENLAIRPASMDFVGEFTVSGTESVEISPAG